MGISKKTARIPEFHTGKKFSYHIKVMKFNERNEMKYIFFHVRNEIKSFFFLHEEKLKINENLCIKESARINGRKEIISFKKWYAYQRYKKN